MQGSIPRALLGAAALALVAAGAAGCSPVSPAKCRSHADCAAGQECANGDCVTLDTDHQIGSRCVRDADCVSWGDCVAGVCTLSPGACLSDPGCDTTWQICSNHACVAAPGFCAGDAGCASWHACGADHLCALRPGRCDTAGECAAWEICGGAHECALAPGHCLAQVDCAQWQRCDVATHACLEPPTYQTDVLVVGDVGITGVTAWAPLRDPTEARWDVDAFSWGFLDPSGALVYRRAAPWALELRRFVPDALRWDAVTLAWTAPLEAAGNDPVLVPTAPVTVEILPRFVMQAGTGALLYDTSSVPSSPRWVDEAGTVRATATVRAWTSDEYLLGQSSVSSGFVVIDPSGLTTPVISLPTPGILAAVRVVPGGFRVAVWQAPTEPMGGTFEDQSWLVARDGSATYEGAFAAPPQGTSATFTNMGSAALADDGALYLIDETANVVIRRPLAPGTSTVVYGGTAPAGYNDVHAVPFRPYVANPVSLVTAP